MNPALYAASANRTGSDCLEMVTFRVAVITRRTSLSLLLSNDLSQSRPGMTTAVVVCFCFFGQAKFAYMFQLSAELTSLVFVSPDDGCGISTETCTQIIVWKLSLL